jgi:hypothetical protein
MQATTTAEARPAANGRALTSFEMEQARTHLDQTQKILAGALRGVSEEQWKYKPGPEAWSIAQNVDHIAFVQERVLAMIREQLPMGMETPADRKTELIDAIVINYFANRLGKYPAPPPLASPKESPLAEQLSRAAANAQEFAECLAAAPDLRGRLLEFSPLRTASKGEHPLIDGYQLIMAACGHTERHVKQILEVKSDPNFPET